MSQEDLSAQSEAEFQVNACSVEEIQRELEDREDKTIDDALYFPIVSKVSFKPIAQAPERGVWHLPSGVARLVSLVSLGALLLVPLSSCRGLGDGSLPCAVPTSDVATTPVPDGTATATCTTSSGTHYLWIRSRGGWTESDDGIHPNSNAHGVGENDGHSGEGDGHSGVGDGHSGEGHGGGDGG